MERLEFKLSPKRFNAGRVYVHLLLYSPMIVVAISRPAPSMLLCLYICSANISLYII